MSTGIDMDGLFSCDGQVAIVTGAARGIGLAVARGLGAAGAHVVLTDLDGDAATLAAQQLTVEGLSAEAVGCDVTDETQLSSLVTVTLARHGHIDTVVANAGVSLDEPDAPNPIQRMDHMYALHVRSVAQLAELSLPPMAACGGGSFIIMSSIAGLRGNSVLAGYGVTKAANAEIARNLAVRWGSRGIRANAISPGVIATDFATPITGDPAAAAARLRKTPLGRFGRPDEVAGAAVWLASRGGAFVTGQNIVIDGGTLIAD